MPLYEYKCLDCGSVSEFLVRTRGAEAALSCYSCGGLNLKKMISSPGGVRAGRSFSGGKTCCGKDERCAAPPCSSGGTCRRD